MAFDPVTAILNVANTVLDRVLPDKQQNDAAKAAMAQALIQGQFDAIKGQLAVNAAEAANANVFVAGWRPFVGWACGCAFIYAFIVQPSAQAIAVFCHSSFDVSKLPQLNLDQMLPVLLGMLGLGTLRTIDKSQGNGNGH